MRRSVVFCSTLFFALIFAFSTLAGDKGRGSGHKGDGGRRGGERRSGDRGQGGMHQGNRPERARSTPGNHPKSAGQKPHVLKDEREKGAHQRTAPKGPGRFDKESNSHKVHVHKHYRSHDHHWFRSRWSFYAGTGGLGFYYGGWDPYLGCHPYYYHRSHYYPRSWVALELYSYWYEPEVVCPVHGFCHHGHCEWYYYSDGGMVLFWYP